MRRNAILPLASLLALAPFASAATFTNFTYTDIQSTTQSPVTFSLSSDQTSQYSYDAAHQSTTITYSGVIVGGDVDHPATLAFNLFNDEYGISIDQGYGDSGNIQVVGITDTPFFTLSGQNIAFTAGTFSLPTQFFILNGQAPEFSGTGELAISQDSTPITATPEPATLSLLGTGVLTLGGAVRRRLRTR